MAEVPVFDAMTQGRTRGRTRVEAFEMIAIRSSASSKPDDNARYEPGGSVPTVEKLDQLLRVIAPARHIVVRQSDAA